MSPTPMFSPEQREQIAAANRKIGEDWNQLTRALVEAFAPVAVEIGRRMRAIEEAIAPIAAARRVDVTRDRPLADYERAIADHLQALAAVAGLVIDGADVQLAEPWVPAELWEAAIEPAPVDVIEADVRERMRGGEPRTGYDFGDPTFPDCPHPWCGEHWHGLAITRRMWEMRRDGELDPDYRYTTDDSEVLCPGSLFEGEFVPPEQPVCRLWQLEYVFAVAVRPRPPIDPEAASG